MTPAPHDVQATFCATLVDQLVRRGLRHAVGAPEVLAKCAAEIGLDHDKVLAFLETDEGIAEIRDELQSAAEMEITAVPTFIFDGKWMVPGAQEPDTFVQVLRRVVAKRTADV